MSNSELSVAERAQALTSYGILGPAKLTTAVIDFIILAMIIPLFIRDQQHPMIKYRSWTLTIFIVALAANYALLDGLLSMDRLVSYETAKIFLICLDAFRLLIFPNFIAMTVRHYYILMLPVLQTQLLDREIMLDPKKYTDVRNQLEKVKVRSTERAVWFYYLYITVPTLVVMLCLIPVTDMDSYVLGYPTPVNQFTMVCSAIELCAATIWFLRFTIRAPNDNFYIKRQYTMVFIITWITSIPLGVSVFLKVDGFSAIAAAIMEQLGFVTIMSIVVFPLGYSLRRTRYKIDSKGSTQTSRVSLDNSSHAKSVSGASQSVLHDSSNPDANLSAKKEDRQKVAGGSVKLTLAKILEDPVMSQAFRKYLAREFSMESLVFIEAVKQFRAHISATPASALVGGELEKAINAVMDEFILPSAVNEVNLPRRYIDKLKTEHDSLRNEFDHTKASKLFDEAGEHIEHMLVVNHLRKFQTSRFFKEAVGLEDEK